METVKWNTKIKDNLTTRAYFNAWMYSRVGVTSVLCRKKGAQRKAGTHLTTLE